MHLKPILRPDELLDIAFSKAKKDSRSVEPAKDALTKKKRIEAVKVKVASEELRERLHAISTEFPSINKLHPFYREIMEVTIDVVKTKQSLSQIEEVSRIIKKVRYESSRKIYKADDEKKLFKIHKEFYGRTSSLVNSLKQSLDYLNQVVRDLKELPAVKFDEPTIILAGYPNTGKTTMLKRMTDSKAKVASYAFTTQSLMLGYFAHKYVEIQVVDTPGLLDRQPEKRNNIEKKAISALNHLAELIVFVIDPTKNCGYSLDKQLNLLEQVKKEFKNKKFLVVINKADIASEEEIKKVETGEEQLIIGEGKNIKLKELIYEKLVKSST